MHMVVRWVCVALLCSACGSKKAGSNKAPSATPSPAPAKALKAVELPAKATKVETKAKSDDSKVANPAPAEIKVIADISAAQVDGLLEQWLKSQNDGDFDAYQSLYAERFFGTKRSGKNTRTFERKGWVRDRKRMFGKRMSVQLNDVEMFRTAESAVVQFEQVWVSGRYKDTGPKQLVVVREAGALRIAREEMIRSVVGDGRGATKPLESGLFHFVVHDDGPYVVLDARPKSDWTLGEPLKLLQSGNYASVTSPAKVKALPQAFQDLQGKTLQLYGPRGIACRGQVVALEIMSRVYPHFGTVNYWNNKNSARPSKKVVTREAWRLGDIGRVLVARLIPLEGNDCRGATWARDAEAAVPKLLTTQSIKPELVVQALRAFRKLKGYRDIQAAYVKEVEMPRPVQWDKYDGASPVISSLKSTDGMHEFISVSVRAGDPCAGHFDTEFWALWRVVVSGQSKRLQLISDEVQPGALFVPRGGVDVDNDGRYEFFGTDSLVVPAAAVVRESISVSVPSLDCGC